VLQPYVPQVEGDSLVLALEQFVEVTRGSSGADARCESGSRDPLEDLTVLLEEKNAMTANTSIDPAESWRSSWRPRRWICSATCSKRSSRL
jgi:hypothetical protein